MSTTVQNAERHKIRRSFLEKREGMEPVQYFLPIRDRKAIPLSTDWSACTCKIESRTRKDTRSSLFSNRDGERGKDQVPSQTTTLNLNIELPGCRLSERSVIQIQLCFNKGVNSLEKAIGQLSLSCQLLLCLITSIVTWIYEVRIAVNRKRNNVTVRRDAR